MIIAVTLQHIVITKVIHRVLIFDMVGIRIFSAFQLYSETSEDSARSCIF